MNFQEILSRVTQELRHETRISYGAIKMRFGVDDAVLQALRDELVEAKRLAIDEGGKVLVWRAAGQRPAEPDPAEREEGRRGSLANGVIERAVRPSHSRPHVVQAVLKRRSELEGELKQITVMFCDVVDSTDLLLKLGPQKMASVMDRLHSVMGEIVQHFGGSVNQYLGDGIMALFGAPVAVEEHAVACAYAALAIHQAIGSENPDLQRRYGVEIRLRIGIDSGEVVVERIANDLQMAFRATGNTTNVADRLQKIAEPGTTLMAEGSQRLAEGYVVTEPLGAKLVKGQHEPVNVYRLVKRRHRSRFQVLAERGLTPLVGRADELRRLAKRYELARQGRGQAVEIVGEAGVGKSRVVHEFVRLHARDEVVCLVGQCSAHTRDTPYVPIIEMLRTMFHVDDGDGPDVIRDKVRRGLSDLEANIRAAETLVVELLAPGTAADSALKRMHPTQMRRRLLDALLHLAKATTAQQPMIMVFEDLHWLDRSSESCLRGLMQNLPDLRLLLIMTYRSPYKRPWAISPELEELRVGELTAADTDKMVAAVSDTLSATKIPADLRDLIREKVGGNPLFVEELTRSVLKRGPGAMAAGQSVLRRDVSVDKDLPPPIRDILMARIDELDDLPRRTVQAAAAVGQVFSARLLAHLPNLGGDTDEALDVATELGLIQEHRTFPDVEYAFRHSVVQDVAYKTMLDSTRKQLHGVIGRAIEDLWGDQVEEQLAVLAYHFAKSDDYERALAYAMRAGEHAERLHARAEAAAHYLAALSAASSVPDSKLSQQAQIDAVLKLAGVAHPKDDRTRDAENLKHAQEMAERLRDNPRLARVLYWRGRLHYTGAEFAEALKYVERCTAIADELRDESLLAPAINLEARTRWQLGDYGKASQLFVRSINQMRRLGNAAEEATAAGFAAWTFALLGEIEQALDYIARAMELISQLHDPFAEAAVRFYRGAVFDQQGLWAEAVEDYARASAIAREAGDEMRVYLVKCQEGRAHAMLGDVEGGCRILQEAIALAVRLETPFVLAWPKAYLAHCLLERGDAEMARVMAADALQLADKAGDKYAQGMAYRRLAGALAAQATPDYREAEESIRHSIRIQHEMAVKPELARTYVEYADLCWRQDKPGQAKAYLNVAIDILRQQGMDWDLKRAEAALAALD